MKRCRVCNKILTSMKAGKKHFREEHGGEAETPAEYLPSIDTEQLDFDGEEPSTEGHNPQYETENEIPDSYMTQLNEYERERDNE